MKRMLFFVLLSFVWVTAAFAADPVTFEYYCREGNRLRNKLEMQQNKANTTAQSLDKERAAYQQRMAAPKRKYDPTPTDDMVRYYEERLQNQQTDINLTRKQLSDLEDQAYRNNVPVGWVRCQK